MCDDELIIMEFLESDVEINFGYRQKRRDIRIQSNPFELDDSVFIKKYSLSKELVLNLCEELRPYLKIPKKTTDLSIETKLLTALSFYATGSYQRATGDISGHSMAQQTVSAVITEITACLNRTEIIKKYIHFPKNLEERNKIRSRFYEQFKIPGVLGCIDGTHIAIIRPTDNEERYYSHKQHHSLNVQLICDADMNITSVEASYGGATQDSVIWNLHPIKLHMDNLNECTWLLGDSGYPLGKCMMTPIINATPGSSAYHYTNLHVQTRNTIERTIGLLKARFRCLLAHRVLHYKPEMAASIIIACVILHNICNRANMPVPELSNEDVLREAQMQPNVSRVDSGAATSSSNNQDLQQGVTTRDALIRRLWDASD